MQVSCALQLTVILQYKVSTGLFIVKLSFNVKSGLQCLICNILYSELMKLVNWCDGLIITVNVTHLLMGIKNTGQSPELRHNIAETCSLVTQHVQEMSNLYFM